MSSLEEAMKKHFGSDPDKKISISASNLEASAEDLEIDVANSKKGGKCETILSEKENADLKDSSTPIKLDMARLRDLSIATSDSGAHNLIEDYRNIKRLLLQNAFGRDAALINDGHLIMITSSVAGEGKSFTSINLALSIAKELDRTVLLVDADVFRQGVSRMLGIENRTGLTDILNGHMHDIADVLIRFEEPELSFLPAGQMYPNVAELLASESMRRLTQELAKRYKDRLILFDTPPILASSEARILAGLVGQILLVVEAERTSHSMVQEAISFLDSSKAIGLVLNKSRQKSSSAYYYGYHDSSIAAAKKYQNKI